MSTGKRHQGAPIGLRLNAVARSASRAFDDALAAAGGTRPTWLVLLALKRGSAASQQQLADEIGIRAATLTHHLAAMESRGLVTRVREAGDRRTQVVRLTDDGERMFDRLRVTARSFDARLRAGVSDDHARVFDDVLTRIAANLEAPVARPVPAGPRRPDR